MTYAWPERTTQDLLGRIMYHQDYLRFWMARPEHPDAAAMVRDLENSLFVIIQTLVRRNVDLPPWYERRDTPFR